MVQTIFNVAAGVLAICFVTMYFIYRNTLRELQFYIDQDRQLRKALGNQREMLKDRRPEALIERVTALENENAALRVDNRTGTDTIEAQIKTINELRRLLKQSQDLNRTQKARK